MDRTHPDKADREHLDKAQGIPKPATLGLRRRKRRPPTGHRPDIETKEARP